MSFNGYKITIKTYEGGEVVTKNKVTTTSLCWDELIIDFCNMLNNIEEPHNFYIPTEDIKEMLFTFSNERLKAFANSLISKGDIDV